MLRNDLHRQIEAAVISLIADGRLPEAVRDVAVEISDTKSPEHGDFACNFALVSNKKAGMPPRAIAELLRDTLLQQSKSFQDIDIAGPGFLNLRLKSEIVANYVQTVLDLGTAISHVANPSPRKLNIEFVSVNPNGPITVGSGRGAAFGDALVRVIRAAGDQVSPEYYINDGVNSQQMRLFAESVKSYVTDGPFPENGYKGDYVKDVAHSVLNPSSSDPEIAAKQEAAGFMIESPEVIEAGVLPGVEGGRRLRAGLIGLVAELRRAINGDLAEQTDPFILGAMSYIRRVHSKDRSPNQIAFDAVIFALVAIIRQGATGIEPSDAEVLAAANEIVGIFFDPSAQAISTAADIQVVASSVATELEQLYGDISSKGVDWYQQKSQELMIERQRSDLALFGVKFDTWFSEQSLHDTGKVATALDKLKANGSADSEPHSYEIERNGKEEKLVEKAEEPGPLWLRATKYGDDKDRVLMRTDGRPAYIAADVAYMENKLGERGFDKAYIILGPDHHGYIARMNAVCEALGYPLSRFEIVIFQLVRFVKDGQPAPMRKRDGNIYELSDLIEELGQATAPKAAKEEQLRIGRDVARFFYLMRSHDSHMDFDIDLATKQSDENPVFYVQYAHARICSVIAKAEAAGIKAENVDLSQLTDPREMALIKKIVDLSWEVKRCAEDYGVHRIATYAIELARTYHHFYDGCRVVQTDQMELSKARVALCQAARIGLQASLDLLGVSAPERMEREEQNEIPS